MKNIKVWLDVQSKKINFNRVESILSEKTKDLNFSISEVPKKAYKESKESKYSLAHFTTSLMEIDPEGSFDFFIALTYVNLEENLFHSENTIVKKIILGQFNEKLAAQLIFLSYCILEKPIDEFNEKSVKSKILSVSSLKKFTQYSEYFSEENVDILGQITYGKHPSEIFVAITHGIRTHAEWMEPAKNTLNQFNINSNVTRYYWVNLLKFAWSMSIRKQYARKFLQDIIEWRDQNAKSRFCISVHSYGSVILVEALELARDLKVNLTIESVILSGSILPVSFDWGRYITKNNESTVTIDRVLNISGSKDYLPILAKYGVRGEVGDSGTFGFSGNSRVTNIRLEKEGHSAILHKKYIEDIWVQFLQKGYVDTSKYEGDTDPLVNTIDYLFKLSRILIIPVLVILCFYIVYCLV